MIRLRGAVLAYAALAGLFLLLAAPALAWLVRTWLTDPYYTHGFLVPVVAGLLGWRQWRRAAAESPPDRPAPGSPGVRWAGWAVALAGMAAFVWAVRWQSYAAASLALVAMLCGALLFLLGWARLRPLLFPLLFLALAVPLPFVDRASPWLQAFTARWATALVRSVGIAASQQGGAVSLPGTTVIVGAPCSGLRSLLALVTLGVAWVFVVRGGPAARAGMLASIVPIVLVGNVLRIALLLVVAQAFGAQAALGAYHTWSSPLLFLGAVGTFLAVGKGVGCSRLRDGLF